MGCVECTEKNELLGHLSKVTIQIRERMGPFHFRDPTSWVPVHNKGGPLMPKIRAKKMIII